MKKDELITFVSESADITKKSAGDAINAAIEGITSALEKGALCWGFGNSVRWRYVFREDKPVSRYP